jgi:hypothetical protein
MKIKKITVRILLYGIPISYMFLGYVDHIKSLAHFDEFIQMKSRDKAFFVAGTPRGRTCCQNGLSKDGMLGSNSSEWPGKLLNTQDFDTRYVTPIGMRVVYFTGHHKGIIYSELPRMQIHNLEIKILDGNIFKDFLIKLGDQLPTIKSIHPYNLNKASGVQLQYVDIEPVIDNKVNALVHGETPKQDHIRPILDVIDQLHRFTPRGHLMITFYVSSGKDNFYLIQIGTQAEYIYADNIDEKCFYFISKSVGKFRYDFLTGNISFDLEAPFKLELVNQFKLNYPKTSSDVFINVITLQPDVTMATITYK